MSRTVIFVTGNSHKAEEAQNALPDFQIMRKSIDLPELQGDPEKIVKTKAEDACRQLKCPVVVDDTSVHITSFGGFPGPYAADYQKHVGNERTLIMLHHFNDRSASMVSRVAYCEPGHEPLVFEGKIEGTISNEIRGKQGFGFDPIFIPNGADKTFAEMSVEEKNKYNHRSKAFSKLAEYLRDKRS